MDDLLTHNAPGPESGHSDRDGAFLTGATRAVGAVVFIGLVLVLTNRISSPGRSSGFSADMPLVAATEDRVDRSAQYSWLTKKQRAAYESLAFRIPVPAGYQRAALPGDSFGAWLRHLPVLSVGSPVKSTSGEVVLAGEHPNLAAVIALQPRSRGVLSAGNILIRLRAEYCWTMRNAEDVAFHFTSGQLYSWQAWTQGVRTRLQDRKVTFCDTKQRGADRAEFCQYLETVFRYSSLISLSDDTREVEDGAIGVGDIFLWRTRSGHAMIVLDVATDETGQVRILLGEGGTPAQTFHVLQSDAGNPWFPVTRGTSIDLSEKGVLEMKHLRRWAR